jgi:hypothetical protein
MPLLDTLPLQPPDLDARIRRIYALQRRSFSSKTLCNLSLAQRWRTDLLGEPRGQPICSPSPVRSSGDAPAERCKEHDKSMESVHSKSAIYAQSSKLRVRGPSNWQVGNLAAWEEPSAIEPSGACIGRRQAGMLARRCQGHKRRRNYICTLGRSTCMKASPRYVQ